MNKKKCGKCKINLSINNFNTDNSKRDKLHTCCKKCRRKTFDLWAIAHPDKMKKYRKKYLKKHKKILAEKAKIYCLINRDKIRAYHLTPAGFYCNLRNIAIKKGLNYVVKDIFIKWYNTQIKKCKYCNRTIADINHSMDTMKKARLSIDRKDNNKGYTLDNIVLCCHRCNTIKSNFFTSEEMLKVGKIIKKKFTGIKGIKWIN